jgi:hypothetical protein
MCPDPRRDPGHS